MGWFGVVFKGDISRVSDFLAIGLTTGYLGSLTTFSGWNQKMIELSVDGQWVEAVLGFLIGKISMLFTSCYGRDVERWPWQATKMNFIYTWLVYADSTFVTYTRNILNLSLFIKIKKSWLFKTIHRFVSSCLLYNFWNRDS